MVCRQLNSKMLSACIASGIKDLCSNLNSSILKCEFQRGPSRPHPWVNLAVEMVLDGAVRFLTILKATIWNGGRRNKRLFDALERDQ